MNQDYPDVLNQFAAQIGEIAQHEVSDDPNALPSNCTFMAKIFSNPAFPMRFRK